LPRPPDAATAGVKRDAAARRIEAGKRGARLHRHAGDALHPGRKPDDVVGAGETHCGGRMIADPGVEHDVRGGVVRH
jgi:hypothetical protein